MVYEKKNICTYSIEINPTELIGSISPKNMESIIAYGFVAAKNNNISGQILEKILFHTYNELNTKAHLKEILTGKYYV